MRAHQWTFLCVILPLVGSPLLAQSPWSKVPALPRACYSGQDAFGSDTETARTELEGLIAEQEQVNSGILDQVFKTDPATLQQRMMAAVQKDPAKAQEIMQAMQNLGTQQSQGAAIETEAEESDFRDRKTKLMEEYRAESNTVLGPSHARAVEANVQTREAAWAEYNRQYEKVVCPRWFGKLIPDLVASYRAYLVERRIPKRTEAEKKHLPMMEMLGVPTKAFRPIAEMQGVVDYLRFASDLFGLRERTPGPPPPP